MMAITLVAVIAGSQQVVVAENYRSYFRDLRGLTTPCKENSILHVERLKLAKLSVITRLQLAEMRPLAPGHFLVFQTLCSSGCADVLVFLAYARLPVQGICSWVWNGLSAWLVGIIQISEALPSHLIHLPSHWLGFPHALSQRVTLCYFVA